MMKKYQLVAWTRNVKGSEEPEVRMIPSLYHEMKSPFFHMETASRKYGCTAAEIRKAVRNLEKCAGYEFTTGHYSEGIRFLCIAANTCLMNADDWDRVYSDPGSYWCYRGETGPDFFRLRLQAIEMAEKYGRTDVLLEAEGTRMEHDFRLLTQVDSEFEIHINAQEAWH